MRIRKNPIPREAKSEYTAGMKNANSEVFNRIYRQTMIFNELIKTLGVSETVLIHVRIDLDEGLSFAILKIGPLIRRR